MLSTGRMQPTDPFIAPVGEIQEGELLQLLAADFSLLLYLCEQTQRADSSGPRAYMNRRLMARLHLECALCEKLLDPFGVQENTFWRPMRKFIAITKHFSLVCLNLLQLKYISILRTYQPESVEGDFPLATNMACDFAAQLLKEVCSALLQQAQKMKLSFPQQLTPLDPRLLEGCLFAEPNTRLALTSDIQRQASGDNAMIIHLASNLLHIIHENADLLSLHRTITREEYSNFLPDPLSEESMGALATHYLAQLTLYDTYIGSSTVVERDTALRHLRNYLDTVNLLLETASLLLRYIERHQSFYRDSEFSYDPIQDQRILQLLFEYFLLYTDRYSTAVLSFCQEFIERYSITVHVEVPIPIYRGFHVRPSNLIARIINHYGSDVTMRLGKEKYNAASPLSLFRANEQINAVKRRTIGALVSHDLIFRAFVKSYAHERKIPPSSLQQAFFRILESLANNKKIMVYSPINSLDDKELQPLAGEKLLDFIKRGIAYLMASGKIDVISNITVTFEGDKRTLTDIEALANNGYGEDQMGNNVMLPSELFYLRR